MNKSYLLSIVLIMLTSCYNKNKDLSSSRTVKKSLSKHSITELRDVKIELSSIYDTVFKSIGILMINDDDTPDFILFNPDGSQYLDVSYTNDSFELNNLKIGLYDVERTSTNLSDSFGFNPYSFYPETGNLIYFKCIGATKSFYLVLVNDNPLDYKLLSTSNPYFSFQKWEDHVFKSFIYFDLSETPFHVYPNSPEKQFLSHEYVGDDGFDALEIQGEWMKVGCKLGCTECESLKGFTGWIKWRDGYNLLIDLRYIC